VNSNLDLENYDDFEAFLNDFTKMDEEKNGVKLKEVFSEKLIY
jgi:hypothetical protein